MLNGNAIAVDLTKVTFHEIQDGRRRHIAVNLFSLFKPKILNRFRRLVAQTTWNRIQIAYPLAGVSRVTIFVKGSKSKSLIELLLNL